jgi:ubiquinone/menaquinone biosynthesis C-methylase UbiE
VYSDYLVPAMFAPLCELLLERARPKPDSRALDVACGTGVVTRRLAALIGPAGRIAGLDLSPGMIEVAKSIPTKGPAKIEWHIGSGLDLPFAAAEFDLVTCQQGLQFFPDRAKGLDEMHRVLAPGGRIALAIWGPMERAPLHRAVEHAVQKRIGVSMYGTPFSLSDRNELRSLVTGARFAVEVFDTIELRCRYTQPERWIEFNVQGAAAAIPSVAALSPAERDALARGLDEDLQPIVDSYVESGMVVAPLETVLVVARRT